jgi:predicted PurR-regulated permease PerM
MFDTSTDVLYLVIAGCVVVFTLFLAWGMYYVVQILKQGNEVITEIREKIAMFEEMLTNIKSKVALSTTSIAFVAKEIGTLVEYIKDKKEPKKKTRKRKKK